MSTGSPKPDLTGGKKDAAVSPESKHDYSRADFDREAQIIKDEEMKECEELLAEARASSDPEQEKSANSILERFKKRPDSSFRFGLLQRLHYTFPGIITTPGNSTLERMKDILNNPDEHDSDEVKRAKRFQKMVEDVGRIFPTLEGHQEVTAAIEEKTFRQSDEKWEDFQIRLHIELRKLGYTAEEIYRGF